MKIFKHKNIMGLIYSVVLAIPLLSILVRSAYVVVNKNAYQSYSGKKENITYVETDSIELGETYRFIPTDYTTSHNITIEYNNIQTIGNEGYLQYIADSNKLILRDDGIIVFYNGGTWIHEQLWNLYYFAIDMELLSVNPADSSDLTILKPFLNVADNHQSFLDNVFDYSLSEYVDENSFGKLNFFEWFFDIFMDSNHKNNLYIRFVNWYMNYVLLVSSSSILFLVLMWFINYSRRILERGLDYDW